MPEEPNDSHAEFLPDSTASTAVTSESERLACRMLVFVLLVSALALVLDFPGGLRLAEPDEGRYADIPAAMARTGDWVTPRLDGVRYFEKPPMLYWLGAASMKVLGPTDRAARLPSQLAALVTALLLYWGGRHFGRSQLSGLLAAALYLASLLGGGLARIVSIDAILSLGTTAVLLLLALAVERAGRNERLSITEALALGGAFAFGVLAKGPVAVVLACGALGLWWLVDSRRFGFLLVLRPLVSGAGFLILSVPWFVLVSERNPTFLRFFFIHEHLERYTTAAHARTAPPGTMIAVLLAGSLPWTVAGVVALVRSFRRRASPLAPAAPSPSPSTLRFFALAALFPVLFFSISKSQLPTYVLPSLAPLALLAALALERDLRAGDRRLLARSGIGAIALGSLAACYAVAAPVLPASRLTSSATWLLLPGAFWLAAGVAARSKRLSPFVAAALFASLGILTLPTLLPAAIGGVGDRATSGWSAEVGRKAGPDATIVCFRGYVWSLPFALGHPVPVVNYRNELDHGMSYPDATDVCWNVERLREEWNSPRRVVVVVESKHLPSFLDEKLAPYFVDRSLGGTRILVSNREWPAGEPGDAPATTEESR